MKRIQKMKKRKKFQSIDLIAGCVMFLSATMTFGQQPDTTKVVKLDEINITATRSERNLSDIGRSVTVITSNEIKNSGANTISELLNQQQGFYILGAMQNPGSLNSIYTRGANNNHTVIMIDGVRITDPSSTDNSIDLSELSLANIERIEIVRGSHSTLYGSSAIGGVINIITGKNNNTPGIHIDADVKGGVFNKNGSINSENLLLNYSHKNGFYITAEAFNNMSKGFNSTIDTITNPNTYKHPDLSDGFYKLDLIGKLGYKTEKFDVYASYKKVNQKSDIDKGAFQDDDNYTIDFKRNLFTYGASYKFSQKLSVTYYGGMSDMERKAVDDSSQVNAFGMTDHTYSSGEYKGSVSSNDLQFNFRTRGIDLVVGGNLYKETMTAQTYYYSTAFGIYESSSNLDSLKIYTLTSNGFIHSDLNGILLNKKLSAFTLGLGGRYVNHSIFGNVLTYEINPSLKLSRDAMLYFSYTTGFNAPSLYQLYSPEKDYNSGITRGNKTLKPEKSSSWEIGIKQDVNYKINWSVCYFNTVVENIIDYVYLWNKKKEIDSLSYQDYFGDTYINLGKQTNRGIEFSILSEISEKFIVSANISLVNGKLEYKPENIDTTHTHGNHIQLYSIGAFINKEVETIGLIRRPNTANISLTYIPVKKLTLRVDVRYVGARNDIYFNANLGPYGALGTIGVEDYSLLGFSVKYEIFKNLSAMLSVENILNTKYYEIWGYATRGRGIYGSIRYTL